MRSKTTQILIVSLALLIAGLACSVDLGDGSSYQSPPINAPSDSSNQDTQSQTQNNAEAEFCKDFNGWAEDVGELNGLLFNYINQAGRARPEELNRILQDIENIRIQLNSMIVPTGYNTLTAHSYYQSYVESIYQAIYNYTQTQDGQAFENEVNGAAGYFSSFVSLSNDIRGDANCP